jgi:hypothetical protein
MSTTDPLRTLSAATDLGQLRDLVDGTGPFLTLVLPSPSAVTGAGERLQLQWRNTRRDVADRWPAGLLDELDAVVSDLAHDDGAAVALVQSSTGAVIVDPLIEPVAAPKAHVDALPRLATIIENRQRTLPHIVVETDRAGAGITAFHGVSLVARETVEGETLHIHRGHPGGWSQRRFQQRAENSWEHNADDVADAVLALAGRIDPVVVAIAGEVQARNLVADALEPNLGDVVVRLESGDPDGIADEVVRLLSDRVARGQRAAAEQLRERSAGGTAVTTASETVDALAERRVATLLVADDDGELPVLDSDLLGASAGTRTVDGAIRAALLSDAEVIVVPSVAEMDGPVAALLRW